MPAVRLFFLALGACVVVGVLGSAAPALAANSAPTCTWQGGTQQVAPLPGDDDRIELADNLECADADGDTLVVRLVQGPSRVDAGRPSVWPTGPASGGSIFPEASIPVRATPATTLGADSIIVRAFDGHAESGDVTVPFEVAAHAADLACDEDPDTLRKAYNNQASRFGAGCGWRTPLNYTVTTAPAHGQLLPIDRDGNSAYLPDPGFVGTDAVTFHVDDGRGQSQTVTRTIDVIAPVAPTCDQSEMAPETVEATGDIAYYVWPDACRSHGGERPRIELVSHDEVGTWDGEDGEVFFTPQAGFTGDVHYAVRLVDSAGMSSIVAGVFHVVAPSTETSVGCRTMYGPVVTRSSRPITIWPPCWGTNADVEIVEPPAHGTLTRLAGDDVDAGTYRYAASPGYSGLDFFTYRGTGDGGPTPAQRAFVQVLPDDVTAFGAESRPRCWTDLLTATAEGDGHGWPECYDDDGDPLTAELTAPAPAHGTAKLEVGVTGDFAQLGFVPASGFLGLDRIVFTATDGTLSTSATVPVWVREPRAGDDEGGAPPPAEPVPPTQPQPDPPAQAQPDPPAQVQPPVQPTPMAPPPRGRRLGTFGGVQVIDGLSGRGRPGVDGVGIDQRTGRLSLGTAYNGLSVPVRFGVTVTLPSRSGHGARAAKAKKKAKAKVVKLGSVVTTIRPGQTAAVRFRVPARLRGKLRGKVKVDVRYTAQAQGGRVTTSTKTATLKVGTAKKAAKKRRR